MPGRFIQYNTPGNGVVLTLVKAQPGEGMMGKQRHAVDHFGADPWLACGTRMGYRTGMYSNSSDHTQPIPESVRLILASSSPRRKELLTSLGLNFETIPSAFDEASLSETNPALLVERLAFGKAQAVFESLGESAHPVVVIGSDTVVELDGQILGKPGSPSVAQNMLACLQGRTHAVYTGLALIGQSGRHTASAHVCITHERTLVTMRTMSSALIERYVATGEPLDKAGAYAIQGLGATLVSGIEGDYFTVMGLPVHRLSLLLSKFGVDIF